MNKIEKVQEIIKKLKKVYPHPKTALHFTNPLELLIATILSAQTTDAQVNKITPRLFARYKTAADFAGADITELDNFIASVNFHHNKAKSIIAACKQIATQHNGWVPQTMKELDGLAGVARKTANVVLAGAFGKAEGIVVDTHVIRLAQKLGLTQQTIPEKIEADLMNIVDKKDWIIFSHLLILHGRDICTARKHTCANCPLEEICPDKTV